MHLLPGPGYEYAKWKVARVGVDYNVEVAGLHCCVPCQQARAPMAMRVTSTAVKVFQRGQRIASHAQCAFQAPPRYGGSAHAADTHPHMGRRLILFACMPAGMNFPVRECSQIALCLVDSQVSVELAVVILTKAAGQTF